jgi:hypothetical protein
VVHQLLMLKVVIVNKLGHVYMLSNLNISFFLVFHIEAKNMPVIDLISCSLKVPTPLAISQTLTIIVLRISIEVNPALDLVMGHHPLANLTQNVSKQYA